MTLGERIKEARKKKGITQKELATLIGKGFSTVQKYEIDVIEPPVTVISKIADVLDVHISFLLPEDEIRLPTVEEFSEYLDKVLIQDIFEYDPENTKRIIIEFGKLNSLGKDAAIEYIKYLTTKEKYTKPDEG